MKFFAKARVEPYELSVLRQFALELDHKVTECGLRVINGPGLDLRAFTIEIDAHQAQLGSSLNEIVTPKGLMLTKSKLYDDLPKTLAMATPEEIDEHYKNIARVTLQRRTTTCEGLAAVALLLSDDLLKTDRYRKIQVEICHLVNWGHVFVRFKHADEAQVLFYDPWFQRCQTTSPEVPVLIGEDEFHDKMNQMVSLVHSQGEYTIQQVRYFHNFDYKTMQLSQGEILNLNDDVRYSIIHSSYKTPPCDDKISDSCVIS